MTRAERLQQRQEWENRIAAYRSSGQSARAWCAANGVKPHQLWYRLSQEGKADKKADSARITWLRAAAGEPAHDGGLLVRVGGGVIEVRPGFDPDLLAMVVRVLSAVC
jgi:hypothetical protein